MRSVPISFTERDYKIRNRWLRLLRGRAHPLRTYCLEISTREISLVLRKCPESDLLRRFRLQVDYGRIRQYLDAPGVEKLTVNMCPAGQLFYSPVARLV